MLDTEIAELTATIVSAYVVKNAVRPDDLSMLIASTAASLAGLAVLPLPAESPAPVPRIPVKKTINREYLISLEDGKQYKTLKRHLALAGLTPDEYRAKWGLPRDYPMTAAAYSERRSALAKSLGLGRKPEIKAAEKPVRGKAKAAQTKGRTAKAKDANL